jgi:hypothetical protein
MSTREEKIQVLKRWMEYFCLSFDDLDFPHANAIEELEDDELQHLMDDAAEDRARHVAEGVFIREDWTEAV